MADWSQLPPEILQLVSEKLNSDFYILRFRSVCSTWRLSTPKPHKHFPTNPPHFSDLSKLFKHSIFLIKPPATPNQQTLRPWLVRISSTSTGKVNLLPPLGNKYVTKLPSDLRVLDFNQLALFNIGEIYIRGVSMTSLFFRYDRYLATFQGEPILDIVIQDYSGSGNLKMHRYGDDGWTNIPNLEKFYHDICIFKGRPCVTDRSGRTLMIALDLSLHLVADPVFDDDVDDNDDEIHIMVENESELLLVHKYDYNSLVMIDVFRLDQKEKKWFKLANLGDTVVFLGECDSFTASALDLGFDNGNFVIYYSNYDNYDEKSGMSIFHLDQRQNSLLSDYPDYFKLFWPPPEWIVSRCL